MTVHCQHVGCGAAHKSSVVGARNEKGTHKAQKTGGVREEPEVHQGLVKICSHLQKSIDSHPEPRDEITNEGQFWALPKGFEYHCRGDWFDFCHNWGKRDGDCETKSIPQGCDSINTAVPMVHIPKVVLPTD